MRNYNVLAVGIMAAAAVAALLATGCGKTPEAAKPAEVVEAAALVKGAERSAHFEAVNRHLELGGTLYGYVDVDGDMARLAEALHGLATSATAQQPMAAAFVPADFAPFFTDLGLSGVKALGLSSVAMEGGGFRNQVFLYAPEGRRGLLAGLGGPTAPFQVTRLAPADADLVYETELDAPAVYAAIRAVVARAAGEPMAKFMDAKAQRAEEGVPLSVRDLVEGMKGRVSLVLRVDEARTFSPAPGVTLPAFDLAWRQEHGGAKLAAALAEAPLARREERAGGVVAFVTEREVPLIGWKPEVLIEGDAFLVVSRADFLTAQADGAKLADDAAFQAALASVGETGNGLTYVSSRFVNRVRRVVELNPEMEPEQRMMLDYGLSMLPTAGVALVSVRQNLPEGVLFRSRWHTSLKQSLVFANPGVFAGVGLTAAMAIPAFQKVRTSSQEKAVLNNLRQLAAAADQYYLENAKESCVYADLVGPSPDKYIRELRPIAGEDYTGLVFRQGQALRVTLANGEVVEYAP